MSVANNVSIWLHAKCLSAKYTTMVNRNYQLIINTKIIQLLLSIW